MLPERTLKALRRITRVFLTDTCTIQRKGALVSNGKGGRIAPFTNLSTDVSCRVTPVSTTRSSSEQVVGAKPSVLFDTLIRLDYAEDVIETDRIVWNARTFEVKKPRPRTGPTVLVVEAYEVK